MRQSPGPCCRVRPKSYSSATARGGFSDVFALASRLRQFLTALIATSTDHAGTIQRSLFVKSTGSQMNARRFCSWDVSLRKKDYQFSNVWRSYGPVIPGPSPAGGPPTPAVG